MDIKNLPKIQSSGYVQWDIYQILFNAFIPYKGMENDSKEMSQEDFIKQMQFKKYITIDTHTDTHTYKIILLNRNEQNNNDIMTVTEHMKHFLRNVLKPDIHLIVIGPETPKKHVQTYIKSEPLGHQIQIHNYDRFKIVVPLGPYVPHHTILTPEEEKEMLSIFNIRKNRLKEISHIDPQLIWMNAKFGDIIRIKNLSRLVGSSIDYRIVV